MEAKMIREYLEERLISPQFGGTVACAYEQVGEDEDGWYGWVFCLERLHDGTDGTGIRVPVVLKLERTETGVKVTGHEIPEDGSGYKESVRRLFPDSVQDRLYRDKIDFGTLEREARERGDALQQE